MKVHRSSKCSLKFITAAKQKRLELVLAEYGKVVNFFIKEFWEDCPNYQALLKPIVDLPETWLSARLRKVAAREAIGMIQARRKRSGDKAVTRPTHQGRTMSVSSTIAELQEPKTEDSEFDAWLHLSSIGNRTIIDLPIRFHKHYNELAERGKRLNSYVITPDYVQFTFEVETGPKKAEGKAVGLDTGMKKLASLSDGTFFGTEMWSLLEKLDRCKYGSNGYRRVKRHIKQRMDECAKEVFRSTPNLSLLVVEKLQNLNYKLKQRRRLCSKMRRFIGSWAWRYWLDRLQMLCEENRVRFRSVWPAYTSQTCPACGLVDKRNRKGEMFRCQNPECDYAGDADSVASENILNRFLSGPYGARFKPLDLDNGTFVYR